MRMEYTIDRRENHNACVLHMSGDIDIAVVPELRSALEGVIETGCHNVVIDLERVTYADSSALGLLVWLDHTLQPRDGKAVLAGANPDVERIFALSGLLTVTGCLEASEDLSEAMACLDTDIGAAVQEWEETITVEADVQHLAQTREQVAEMIAPMAFSESALFDIKVALGEALANAVRHGSPEQGGNITIAVAAYEDRVVLEVTDTGGGFDGEHVCADDLYAVGGRGVMFMRALMDSVCFAQADGGGTTVRLVKHRTVGPPPREDA